MNVAKGIGATLLVQLVSRGISFGVNVFIPRMVSPEDYGIGYVSFQLVISVALFFTKECFTKVALRNAQGSNPDELLLTRSSQNLGWCGLGATLVALLPLTLWRLFDPPSPAPDWYSLSLLVLAGSIVFEAAAQPCLISCLRRGQFAERASGEGCAVFFRTICMLALVLTTGNLPLAFAVSQLGYGVTYLGWFISVQAQHARGTGLSWLPARVADGRLLLSSHLELLTQFGWSTLLKLLLTEGEKFMLLALFSEAQWGVYGLVTNLGSMVLRLLFAPIEEIAYAAFGADNQQQRKWPLLRALLLLQGTIGWLAVCFGPTFAPLAVRLLYGENWASSDAPTVLAAYCVLLMVLALNGILDAFFTASASVEWLARMRVASGVSSGVLVAVAWTMRTSGPVALVWANIFATSVRVVACGWFVKTQLTLADKNFEATRVPQLFGMLAAAGALTAPLVWNLLPDVHEGPMPWKEIAICVAAGGGSIVTVLGLNRSLLMDVYKSIRSS